MVHVMIYRLTRMVSKASRIGGGLSALHCLYAILPDFCSIFLSHSTKNFKSILDKNTMVTGHVRDNRAKLTKHAVIP